MWCEDAFEKAAPGSFGGAASGRLPLHGLIKNGPFQNTPIFPLCRKSIGS